MSDELGILEGADDDLQDARDYSNAYLLRSPSERHSARKMWGFVIVGLFCVSTIGTLLLLGWAFWIDQKILFSGIDVNDTSERIITTDVVLRLINATVFQVGAASTGIIGWAFFGSKGWGMFKGRGKE